MMYQFQLLWHSAICAANKAAPTMGLPCWLVVLHGEGKLVYEDLFESGSITYDFCLFLLISRMTTGVSIPAIMPAITMTIICSQTDMFSRKDKIF